MKKSTRREIAKDTLRIIKQGYLINRHGDHVSIGKAQNYAENNTILYTPEMLLELIRVTPKDTGNYTTEFEVNGLTTLNSVQRELEDSQRVVCLNFASARNPGGGFLNGSQAQEESIARATGLYPCQLKAKEYYVQNRLIKTCIYTDHMIYSPQVPILKDEDGVLLEEVVQVSIITAPAVNTGVVLRNEPENIEFIEARMSQRIDMVLAICREKEYETLVLGAWGCGVFRNDPIVISQMFYNLLNGKYKNQFKRIVFSVYSKNEKFIKPFEALFV